MDRRADLPTQVKLLLDTHVIIWAAVEPDRLSVRARDAVSDPDNDLMLSAASAYEIEYKRERDDALRNIPPDLRTAFAAYGLTWLDVTAEHAAAAGRLPRHHGDPFDRLLIAQAVAEGAFLVSADRRFPAYGVAMIW